MAETVQEEPREAGDLDSNFLTAIVTQNASESDKPGMAIVLSSKSTELGAAPVLHVDDVCGPSPAKLKKISANCMAGRHLSPDRGKVFTVEAFDIKVERQAICPSGRQVATVVGCVEGRPARWIIDPNGTAPRRMSKKGGSGAPRRPTVRWSIGEYHTFVAGPSQGDADRGVC